MKKIYSYILLCIILMMPAVAANAQQTPQNRANSTIISDVLNLLPADDAKQYTSLMEDIISTGDEGLRMLINFLEKKNDASVSAQYAIDGLCAYASADSFDSSAREAIIAAIKNASDRNASSAQPDGDLAGFYEKQLRRLGVITAEPAVLPQAPATDEKSIKAQVKETVAILRKGERFQIFQALNAITKPEAFYSDFSKILPKLNREAMLDVIWWMGEQKDIANEQVLLPYIKSTDKELLCTAAWALTKIGSEEGMTMIANFLLCPDPEIVTVGEECLKCSRGPVADVIAENFKLATPAGKAASLRILAQRHSLEHQNLIFYNIESDKSNISDAAYDGLKNVVSAADLEKLYGILESSDEAHSGYVCDAIIAALQGKTKAAQYDVLSARRASVDGEKKNAYIPLLIRTGNIDQIFSICLENRGSSLFAQAFNGYLDAVDNSNLPGAQKLLLADKAMGIAADDTQRSRVLDVVSTTGEFPGIIYAGRYIDTPALQSAAADAVKTIALANPEYNGAIVTGLLNKVINYLETSKVQDYEYTVSSIRKHLDELPAGEGFVSMFDGVSLAGWKGLVENPIARRAMSEKQLTKAQKEADVRMNENWKVEEGCIVYEGKGFDNLCTSKQYGDFEMYVDWMLDPNGAEPDAGIYLRGTPQVQIWDTSRVDVGAQVGSGGLYNNQKHISEPLCVADNRLGEWNSFYIKMVGERVTVLLNGIKVVDNVIMENYWDRSQPIPMVDQIELQAHGSRVFFRNLYIKEFPHVEPATLSAEEQKEGFELLFDGTSMHRFKGNLVDYTPEDGTIHVNPTGNGYGNLYVDDEYSDFIFRFEFKLTHGANNGVGIRCEEGKDAAYYGMEIQILDHFDPIYEGLRDYQHHGSVYGIIPAQITDELKPVGEWNCEEIYAKGSHIRVTVNGIVVTEGDIVEATKNGTYDGNDHPGLFNKSGHIGFLGHGSELWIRNVRVKKIK